MKPVRRRQYAEIILILIACVWLGGCEDRKARSGDEQDPSVRKEYSEGPLQVQLKINADQILLSELLQMEIRMTIESEYEVEVPNLAETFRDFRIRDWEDAGRKLRPDGRIQSLKRYRLEPLKTGELQIPPFEFQFYKKTDSDMESDRSILVTEAVPVAVATTLQTDLSEVSIADIEDVVEMKRRFSWIWMSAIAAAVLGGIAAGVFLLRPKKAQQVRKTYRPAHEIALEWIRKLAEQRLIEQGKVKEFYLRLSNCLRHYIENRFSLRAPEQTTEEFLAEIRNSPILRSEHKEELKKFLEHCDLVKFAKFQPTQEQNDQSLQMAEQFILNTKSDERLVEAGQNGESG